jgi:hypothetical protein
VLRQQIEDHLAKTIRKLALAHDPTRLDVTHPESRPPETDYESMKLGFLQGEVRRLVYRLRDKYPKDARTRRILDIFKDQVIAIDTTKNQGQMRYSPRQVLAINISNIVAKNLMTICHELAHCSLPSTTPNLSCGHGPAHTEAWLWLLKIATEELGWEYVELACPDSCTRYGICDPRRQAPGCYIVGTGCGFGGFVGYPPCATGGPAPKQAPAPRQAPVAPPRQAPVAPPKQAPVAPRNRCPKRGLGGGTPALLSKLRVSWMYRWHPDPPVGLPSGVEFVGMKARWWPLSISDVKVGAGGTILLYNEPNHAEQAKMGPNNTPGILTPAYAAAEWPAIQGFLDKNPGVRIGAPCPANNGSKGAQYPEPTKWLDEYIAALPPGAWDKIAFTTIHYYGNSVDALKAYVDKMWTKYRKPVWITEFAAVGSAEDNKALMKKALPWLDSHPHVERYAWYPHGSDPLSSWLKGGNALLDAKTGELTDLGKMYACA